MQIFLETAIIEQLSSKGLLAYLAVRLADGTAATTAVLAGLVRCQTAVMRDGLAELAVAAPGSVGKHNNKWHCGQVKAGDGDVVQNLDSERYRMFVDDLKKYSESFNLTFTMDGRDGVVIQRLLKKYREWDQETWRTALRNRWWSVQKLHHASPSEPLYVWVGRLDMYLAGPLDRFNKPMEGGGNGKAAAIQERNSEAGAAYLNRKR